LITLKLLIRYPVAGVKASRLVSRKKAADSAALSSPPLVLDLRTTNLMFDGGRHLYTMAHYAAENRVKTLLRCRHFLLSGIVHKTFGREMLDLPHSGYLRSGERIPKNALVLGDYQITPSEKESFDARGIRYMQMQIGREVPTQPPIMPYPMHPWTLEHLDEDQRHLLRDQRHRQNLILFAGCQKPKYGTKWMREQFKILSRLEVLDVVRKHFPKQITETHNQDEGNLDSCDQDRPVEDCHVPPKIIQLLDSKNFPIDSKRWLAKLADSHFFLCGPGGRQPICHHLTEAMAVGTIPILEYGDRIYPELTDGINAIRFSGKDGLVESIRRVLSMEQTELNQMRQSVIAFYDQHLCGRHFFAQLLSGKIAGDRIAMPFHEKNFT